MRVTLRGNRYSSLWWEDVRSRVFLQKLLSESNRSPYLSLQFWLLWCIESHQRQERRKHQRPLEDDRGTTKRKCEEVLETERVRRTRAQSTSFSLDLLKRIKADGRVTCPCVWHAPGGSFLFCIKVLNVRPHWPAGSPILPRGTRDVIWKYMTDWNYGGRLCCFTGEQQRVRVVCQTFICLQIILNSQFNQKQHFPTDACKYFSQQLLHQ